MKTRILMYFSIFRDPVAEKKKAIADGMSEREKRRKRVEQRCKQKAKIAFSKDRLIEDKNFLNTMSRGIGPKPGMDVDDVEMGIAESAYEALFFLKGRHLQ